MGGIGWTEEAATWLETIHDYIAERDPAAARSVACGIYEKIQILGQFPQMGQKIRDVPEGEVRSFLYGHYRIAYLHREEGVIVVLGVFHGAMDIDRYL